VATSGCIQSCCWGNGLRIENLKARHISILEVHHVHVYMRYVELRPHTPLLFDSNHIVIMAPKELTVTVKPRGSKISSRGRKLMLIL
jgi:hypothetical protein